MNNSDLPSAPATETGPVKAWHQPMVIPTYDPAPADKNPMFLENRVYQGSNGKVYPLPFIDRISEVKKDRSWQAVHLENEYIRIMILPEIGGRIHIGLDKTNGYDFFYRQYVIKPALVGLAGPWISGGVEFNWPQHHRPSTFMPVQTEIEHHADGSVTVWCSEHDTMNRTKGMHGVCLHPGRSVVELKVRLFNRTPFTQTFLWWANVGTRVHERYQSFFPPDVSYVADHAKRAMSRFPLCDNSYYGVDYGKRGRAGLSVEELPRKFVASGDYPANDLSWYANIPVPTSYMVMGTMGAFLGGYDHSLGAGLVHVANPYISPGKKQWTWGNQEFGYAWDRNLTDDDGPYIELMGGVYTDNQPDFSFMHPGETRTWSQFWYPIQKIGPVQEANVDAAISLTIRDGKARIGVISTRLCGEAEVRIKCAGELLESSMVPLGPDNPHIDQLVLPTGATLQDIQVSVLADGRTLIVYQPIPVAAKEMPEPAQEPAFPKAVKSNEQLYLIGLHLDQYRHATRHPEHYWREALRRDPTDTRCQKAMGRWHLRRGEFTKAAEHFTQAIAALTAYNSNPEDGEAFYLLGITLRYLGRDAEAYPMLYKATWNYAWQSAAFYCVAQIDSSRGNWEAALEHLDRALRVNADHLQARNLKVVMLRKLGRDVEAATLLADTSRLDPLDTWTRQLSGNAWAADGQIAIDLALDYAAAGLFCEAITALHEAPTEAQDGTLPMLLYCRAYLLDKLGDTANAKAARQAAQAVPTDYCFPARLEEMLILESAIAAAALDCRAPYYLGNFLYDRRRHEEAIVLWERAVKGDANFAIPWRNLGIGYFNIRRNSEAAMKAYDNAFKANPLDARLLYERDQLWKRLGKSPEVRLKELAKHPGLVQCRDDLSIEMCALYNQTGSHQAALELLQSRKFQPWEGGEGLAISQYVRTQLALGQLAMANGQGAEALAHFEAALNLPANLGEAKHPLVNQSDIHYFLGLAATMIGDSSKALRHFTIAAEAPGDFQAMAVQAFSEMTAYSALAKRALGRHEDADHLLQTLLLHAESLRSQPAKVDYFATSLPTMLLFADDLDKRQAINAGFLTAQAHAALGNIPEAVRRLHILLEEDPNHALAADLLARTTDMSSSAV